ncbi:MAG: hypothetical protein IPQ19_15525 [Bacteroidetes bacterium]|nr:hypothetical protein [Bacteroidota bacterium]
MTNDIDNFYVNVTFEGETRKCKQFNSLDSDEGKLIGGCTFFGDDMAITFAGSNYLDPTKSNGFNGSFAVGNVTRTGIYSFNESVLDEVKETIMLRRFNPGPASTEYKIWDNKENIDRNFSGGFCRENDLTVGVQEIDVTRFSTENGGIIEGTFYMTVYETPEGCFDDIPHLITGVFRCKRINIE